MSQTDHTEKRIGSAITIENLRKTYGKFHALDGVSLGIAAGEFVSILGPSGSGKTTMLMSLAGFSAPSSGRILVQGEDIVPKPAHKRNIGIVFQKYSLFPHMTVAQNVAFPLRMRGVARVRQRELVIQALERVQLAHLADRYPQQLSGGQQQRVALARAIVFDPPLLLMDEPLGALDKKLREELQVEIKLLHERLGITIVFVTHDQHEALAMSDRIAVMNNGRIEQIGTPAELYDDPQTEFVSGFVGNSNNFAGKVASVDAARQMAEVDLGFTRLAVALSRGVESWMKPGAGCSIVIRQEAFAVVDAPVLNSFEADILSAMFAGAHTNLMLETAGQRVTIEMSGANRRDFLSPGSDRIRLACRPQDCMIFPQGQA